jgi:hypothetical protein
VKISKNHINFALLKWNSSFWQNFASLKKKVGGGGFSYINFGSELGHPFYTRRVGRWILPSVPSESILPSVTLTSPPRPHLAESAVHSPFQSLRTWILPCVPFRAHLAKSAVHSPFHSLAPKSQGELSRNAKVTPKNKGRIDIFCSRISRKCRFRLQMCLPAMQGSFIGLPPLDSTAASWFSTIIVFFPWFSGQASVLQQTCAKALESRSF